MTLTFEQFVVLVAFAFFVVYVIGEKVLEWRRIGKQPTLTDFLGVFPSLDSPYTRSGVETLYNSLPEREKGYVLQFLELASPLTNITSFDEDNELLQWLKDRTTSPAPSPEEIPYNPSENRS
jgi:hypothetical protein